MPPLRARPNDVLPLATFFLQRFARENGKIITGFDEDALNRIVTYRWPGNVRELENVIEQSLVFTDGDRLAAEALPAALRGDGEPGPRAEAGGGGDRLPVPSGEMARRKLGPRGVPGASDTATMTRQSEKNVPKRGAFDGHTE